MQTAIFEQHIRAKPGGTETIVRFPEGLIGFAEAKNFVLIENENIAPLRLLQGVGSNEISFLVLDATVHVPDYCDQIQLREWEALNLTEPGKRLAFVIVNVGLNPRESTGNFQAPLLINYETMCGRQVILTDSGFCLRHPLIDP